MNRRYCVGDWLVEPQQNRIVRDGEPVRLDPRVMQVLVCLVEKADEVVPQEQIIEKVWAGVFVTDGVLTNAIWELRKALGDDSANPRFIQTVPKKGYRLVAKVSAPGPMQRFVRTWILAGFAALVTSVGGVFYFWPSPRSESPSRPARFVLNLPEGHRLPANPRPFFALSPDGSRLVYVAEKAGSGERLYLRDLDEFEASPLPGTEGASNPFFSPDGEWVGFHAAGKLRKVAVAGGVPIPIADALESFGATWGEDDTIVFVNSRLTGLYEVKSSGGRPEIVFSVGPDEIAWCPKFLPGGREILFVLMKGAASDTQIVSLSLDTGETRILLEGHFASYAETGHLLYAVRGSDSIFAIPFDRERLEIRGKPVPVLENVAMEYALGAQLALSRNGTLFYKPGRGHVTDGRSLVLVDRDGNPRPLTEFPRHYDDPRFSPDGRSIAYASEGDIWTLDVTSGRINRLTFNQESRLPVWSPDGDRILFRLWRVPEGLFVIAADGGSREERLTSGPGEQLPGSWSSDDEIVFEWDTPEAQELHVLPLQGPRKARSLQTTGFGPKLSPDGRWMAYASGRPREIYVQRFPGDGGKWQVSSGGGNNPVWGPDGREIFYLQDAQFMVVSVETDPVFSAGPPTLLFEYPDWQPSGLMGFPNYDVSPDGKTFVVVKRAPPVTEFNVVLNWYEELERRVPTR